MTARRAVAWDWGIPALVVTLSVLVWAGIPQYFRYDDPGWLHFAGDNAHTPWRLLSPAMDRSAYSGLGAYYRPAVALVWWAVSRVGGVNPVPYQIVSGALFVLSVVYLLLAVRVLASRLAAWCAVVVFLAFVPDVAYGVHRLGLLHLPHAALLGAAYHLARVGGGARGRHVVAATAWTIVAALSRQPAVVILPAACAAYICTAPDVTGARRLRHLATLAAIAVPAALVVLTLSRPGDSVLRVLAHDGAPAAWAFLAERAAFYGGVLTRGPHAWILAASALATIGAAVPARGLLRWVLLGLPLGAPFVMARPAGAALTIAIGLLAAAARWRPALVAIVWAVAALVPYLALPVYYPKYLEEAAYGLAAAAGVGIAGWIHAIGGGWTIRVREWAVGIGVAIVLAVTLPVVPQHLGPTRRAWDALAGARSRADNMRAVLEASVRAVPESATIVEPSAVPVGLRGVGGRAAGAIDREAGLAPMEARDLTEMLHVLGRADLRVVEPASLPVPAGRERDLWVVCLTAGQIAAAGADAETLGTWGQGDARTALLRVRMHTGKGDTSTQ